MSITNHLRDAFQAQVRARGAAYAHAGCVQLNEVRGTEVKADVRGSQIYQIKVQWERSKPVSGSCTCKTFARGALCKHLWATLLELDRVGWQGPGRLDSTEIGRTGQSRSELGTATLPDPQDTLGTAVEFERQPVEPRERIAPHHPRSTPPARLRNSESPARPQRADSAARGAGRKNWRDRLRPVWSEAQSRTSRPNPFRAATRHAWYFLIHRRQVLSNRRLRISFFAGTQDLEGRPSALHRRPLHEADIQSAPADEVELLGDLFGLATFHNPTALQVTAGPHGGSRSDPVSYLELPAALHAEWLARLAQTGRLGLVSDTDPASGDQADTIQWLDADVEPTWSFALELKQKPRRGFELRGQLERKGRRVDLEAPDLLLQSGVFFLDGKLGTFAPSRPFSWISTLRSEGPISIPQGQVDEFLARLYAHADTPALRMQKNLHFKRLEIEPTPELVFEAPPLELASSSVVGAALHFTYGNHTMAADDPQLRMVDSFERTLIERNLEVERKATLRLLELGFVQERTSGAMNRVSLPAPRLHRAIQTLLEEGFEVKAERLPIRSAGPSEVSVSSGIDFFDLEGGIEFGDEVVSLPALLRAYRAGKTFVRLDDGSTGLLPAHWIARWAQLAELGEDTKTGLRFARSQVGVVEALLAAQDRTGVDRDFAALQRKLAQFSGIRPVAPPASFRGKLRKYQQEGLGWLRFLRSFEFGGCLADDMGLGKTVQVLALLLERKRRRVPRGQKREPSLVVVPRSLIYHWIDEAGRFAPSLSVLDYTRPDRAQKRADFADSDLIVATYGIVRRDIDTLCLERFDYVILDEAQAIKNATSQAAQSTLLLRSQYRLAITGTPVENHLGELASIFEFLNPGMLGRSEAFRELFAPGVSPDAADSPALATLARALRPFILRRTKDQVLSQLPSKTEQTLYCELEGEQKEAYESLRVHYQQSLLARVAEKGIRSSQIQILEALLRLRQAACHPGLIDPSQKHMQSAKLSLLFDQIDEVLEEDHKALVFSQFTKLLALVREEAERRGIRYAYLDGRTRDRKARVQEFQEDPDCRLFLISLKAGGVGLNLTAADYVFILDPWWNPAVEAQAIDRAHRIGQKRSVFAYRVIARDTVEEKILRLQERKRSLADAILTQDRGPLRGLSAEDLTELLG